jgi:hypothetical protein
MRKLVIESIGELENIFKNKSMDMTVNIRDSIQEAFDKKKKTALLFEIEVEGMDTAFEIAVTSKEWVPALENCLKHFEEWEMGDDAIDTYLLIKQLKKNSYGKIS